jgi:UDP-N-acetylmuramoyl-tripeptide--D-alanyl-D-alanine ligase
VIPVRLGELATVVGGSLHGGDPDLAVTAPAFVDSRHPVRGGLFVAIEGEHVDGHAYVEEAMAGGAVAILSRRIVEAPCVVVAEPIEALGMLAHRIVTALPGLTVIGITGSQGKTSAKDILAQLLEQSGETVSTHGSYNNEIGLPLTVLFATETTRFLVVEMGARGIGHIQYLASMSRPSVGLVLNVGVAHIGEFGSKAEIALAKGELVEALPRAGVAVLNGDDPLVTAMADRTDARVLFFGERGRGSTGPDVWFTDVALDNEGRPHFTLGTAGEAAPVSLDLVGEHQVANATAAAAVALDVGMPFGQVVEALRQVERRSRWRMEVSTNRAGVTVINDSYNANPDSMRAALKTLAELGHRRRGRTIAVLGEMLELGAASRDEHDAIGRLAVRLDIAQVVVVGEGARPLHLGASLEGSWNGESVWVPDVDAAIRFVTGVAAPGDIVLVKASRAAGLEKVAEALLDETETGA